MILKILGIVCLSLLVVLLCILVVKAIARSVPTRVNVENSSLLYIDYLLLQTTNDHHLDHVGTVSDLESLENENSNNYAPGMTVLVDDGQESLITGVYVIVLHEAVQRISFPLPLEKYSMLRGKYQGTIHTIQASSSESRMGVRIDRTKSEAEEENKEE